MTRINPETLMKKLVAIQPHQPWILQDAVKFAAQNNISATILWDRIPPHNLKQLDPASLAIIEANSDEEPPVIAQASNGNDPEAADRLFAETAERLGGRSLKKSWKANNAVYWRVTDEDQMIVEPVEYASLGRYMQGLLTERAEQEGWILRPGRAGEMAAYLVNKAETIEHPLLLARKGERQYCRYRPKYKPARGPFPTWESVFRRMQDGEALAAWIGGVESGDYYGRQVPWLHGPAGQDGKSTISKVITRELFGPTRNVISNATVKENRFLNSFFEDSEIVLYPDANNLHLLRSEAFKTIAGGGADEAMIEGKGKQGYLGQLRSRLWVCSNYPPSVIDEGFVTSRLLYMFIDKFEGVREAEPIINQRLIDELPAFLYWTRECYSDRCQNDYEIQVNEKVQVAVSRLTEEADVSCDIVFSENWETGSMDEKVKCSVVHEAVSEAAKLERFTTLDRKNFADYLERRYGIVRRKVNGEHYYIGMRKKGFNPDTLSADLGF